MTTTERLFSELSQSFVDSLALVRRLGLSSEQGWKSLLLEHSTADGQELIDTTVTPDQTIVVSIRGRGSAEVLENGRRRRLPIFPGGISLIPGGKGHRVSWRLAQDSKLFERAYIFLPQQVVREAAEYFRRPGLPAPEQSLEALAFSDGSVSRVCQAALSAMHSGAPDLYAQATASWLAVHLLASPSGGTAVDDGRQPGVLQDQRLARVVDYMRANIGNDIDLGQLALEAGVSKFHFSALFRRTTGVSPIQYLYDQRLSMAAKILADTDFPMKVVASQCGFKNVSHFATSFRKRFGSSPVAYRARRDGS